MKQKITLIIAIAAIVFLLVALIGGGKKTYKHCLINGTDRILGPSSSKSTISKDTINFYMENSASMDGYVNGATEFKDVLGQMIVKANHFAKATGFFFVNEGIHDVTLQTNGFIAMLNPSNIKVGNVGNTDINKIFRNVLDKTDKHNISVLFSDFIYSVSDVDGHLDGAKNATTDAFNKAIKKNPNLATIILQFKSKFNGIYYDRNNHPYSYQGERPYYVFIVGEKASLKELNQKSRFNQLPGFMNKYFLSADSWTIDEQNASAIISDYTNARMIKPYKDNNLDITKISLSRNCDELQFAVGVNCEDIFADNNYLQDPNNYEIEPSDYKVAEIKNIDASSLAAGDLSFQSNSSYAVCLTVPTGSFAQMITISLKNNLPQWVIKSNTEDDAGGVPAPNKSFAILKMIEGVFNAYDINDKSIYKLEININKYNR